MDYDYERVFFFLIWNHCQTHFMLCLHSGFIYIKTCETGFVWKLLYNFCISLVKLFNFKSI